MRMNIIGGIFIMSGLCLGLVALVALLTDSGGSLACITSLVAMAGGTLLIQEAQRPIVLPLLRKVIRQTKRPPP